MAEQGRGIDEGQLFEDLCELTRDAQARALAAMAAREPAMAARLRRLLAIDDAYAAHTARSVRPQELPDPVDGISDIGAFRLVERIGRGGMGVVYLAERRSGFAQRVALKLMPRFVGDEAGRERFARERALLAQLRHPNICTILDGGELPDGTPWLAMEYVPGDTLCAWCAQRNSSLRERIALFLQLCDAVQYAHRNLVVHRDLKDSNVLVDDSGHLKLLDFGIARSLVPNADGQTLAQDAFFSPMTAAPEQVRGERVAVGADVYALGAMLHQLLCGRLPFEQPKRSPVELQRAILELVPPRMSDVVAGLAPGRAPVPAAALRGDLDAIVAQCLRKDAAERYAEVGELARDLRAWLGGHPISIARGDRLYRARKFLQRHRLTVALATTAFAGLLVALGVTLWQADALRRERDAAEAARRQSEVDRDRARTVAAFMRDTFEEADPGRATRGDLLARELIERGRRRLDGLESQQDVQAELALLLAESYAGMGLLRESEDLLRRYDTVIERLATTDPDARWRARRLSLGHHIRLDTDGPELDRALSQLEAIATTPWMRVEAASLRARLHERRSQFGAAARTLEAAQRDHGATLSPEQSLQLRVDLGNALLSANRIEDSRRICARIAGEPLDGFTPALQVRALRLLVRERESDSRADASLTAAILRWRDTAVRLYGEESLEAAKAYEYMVDTTDDRAEQDALVAKAYAIHRAKLPLVSTERAHAEFNTGHFLGKYRNDIVRAEPYFARAVEIGRRLKGRGHADVLRFEVAWARALNALGRHARCLEALSNPPELPEDASDATRLGNLRLALAEAAAAQGLHDRAMAEIVAIQRMWTRLGQAIPDKQAAAMRRFASPAPTIAAPVPAPVRTP
ncbi:serine/threonine-protein kinase [Lysobacter brunescens]|uniref:Protein kinase n=1 Tax=Lysobacter brunescens TaxID=262323 RepID=A0ABW2Y934_9GAMM